MLYWTSSWFTNQNNNNNNNNKTNNNNNDKIELNQILFCIRQGQNQAHIALSMHALKEI